jgi:hypothetical protein
MKKVTGGGDDGDWAVSQMLHKQSLLVDTAMTPSDISDQRMWGYNVRTK